MNYATSIAWILTLAASTVEQGLIEQLSILPRHTLTGAVAEDKATLRAVAKLSEADARRLLASPSAEERGAGVWILYARESYQALFEAFGLLDDDAPTLPYQGMAAVATRNAYMEQTVREYLMAMYWEILGHEFDASTAAEFRALYLGVARVDVLIEPWVSRLMRARGDLDRTLTLKAEVRTLPVATRWMVMSRFLWLYPQGYTPEEAAAELALLSADTKRKIMDGTIEPPLDPLYRKRVDGRAVNEWRDGAPPKWALETARSSLTSAPPAPPAPEETPAAEPPAEAPPE